MAVPKKRTTKSHQLKRRQNIFLEKPNLVKCPKCGHFILPHTVCSYCGYYRGIEVINVLEKLEKKERKKREKEMKAKEKEGKEIKETKPLDWRELSKK
ncbi:MAG: 50S ribosomal protein L32 [Parcubacteria group bacterium CG1_02_36_42]|nr:MAG: 50S ribosomal protein L32 [Parcubacteria group bacterium CG1_02_36_42]